MSTLVKAQNANANPWTTVIGIILVFLVPFLSFCGIVQPTDVESTQGYLAQVFTAIAQHGWISLVMAIGGLVLIYKGYDSLNLKQIWANVTKNPWTSLTGLLTILIFPLLVYLGVISQDVSETLKGYWTQLADAIQSHNWEVVLTVLIGLFKIFFAKDKP